MNDTDHKQEIEGFREIQIEKEVLQKYGTDYVAQKGRVSQVISMFHPKRIGLIVSEVRQEGKTAKSFRLISADTYLPPFRAGQYISLSVDLQGIRTNRPYSITSSPNQTGYYDIAVRRVKNGFVSNYLLDEVKVGDRFESTGPWGNFFYNPLFHGNDLVFLAGGCGITPFMSMIREVTDRGLDRKIHLIYRSHDSSDIMFREELEDRGRRHDNLTVSLVFSKPPQGYTGLRGYFTADLMKNVLGDISGKTFYICGPEAMYPFCLPELQKLGVPRARIRMEASRPPGAITNQPGWPENISADAQFKVDVKGKKVIRARAGEPLIISMEKAGMVVPSSCRAGECSLCRTRLLSGKVFQPSEVKLRKSDRAFGYIHSCLAYPLQDLEIMI